MRLLVPALLIGDHPRKVQGVDILRIETQSVRVRRFGFAEAPRLVMLQPIAGELVRRSATCAWLGIGLGCRLCGSLEPIQHQGFRRVRLLSDRRDIGGDKVYRSGSIMHKDARIDGYTLFVHSSSYTVTPSRASNWNDAGAEQRHTKAIAPPTRAATATAMNKRRLPVSRAIRLRNPTGRGARVSSARSRRVGSVNRAIASAQSNLRDTGSRVSDPIAPAGMESAVFKVSASSLIVFVVSRSRFSVAAASRLTSSARAECRSAASSNAS